ncbi:hypothetical protein NC651_027894 [Populus alba x Populus x berolinensis]|nr:hypothetical protein NC651_027872 [Populus alba x Populus x berolinensis]KAJ6881176.1 hypothetical protein NC651_027894 [Populus alba x Populus x berolinensis]
MEIEKQQEEAMNAIIQESSLKAIFNLYGLRIQSSFSKSRGGLNQLREMPASKIHTSSINDLFLLILCSMESSATFEYCISNYELRFLGMFHLSMNCFCCCRNSSLECPRKEYQV